MVLKMKNINFWGVHWKSQLLGGGRNIEGGDCLKRRVGLFADLGGGGGAGGGGGGGGGGGASQENRGDVFERG